MDTIIWQRLEGACVCLSALALLVFMGGGIAWWLATILFFAPDISFAGYLAGRRFGALVYNLVHVYAFGTVILAVGVGLDAPVVAALGTLWIAHSGLDRMLGYGLKSPKGFTVTHLGTIGR
jgi:hypothetical protein